MKMTEKEVRRRYDEIKSENIEVIFVEGDTMKGKLLGYTSSVNNEPDEASIDVDEYELYASEIAEIRESL